MTVEMGWHVLRGRKFRGAGCKAGGVQVARAQRTEPMPAQRAGMGSLQATEVGCCTHRTQGCLLACSATRPKRSSDAERARYMPCRSAGVRG